MSFPRSRWPRVERGGALTLLLVSMVLLALMATACGRTTAAAGGGGAQVELESVGEKAVGPATIEVLLRDAQGRPIESAEVSVRGDMNHAGMKPVQAAAKHTGGGRYQTEGFRFTMGGDWILTVLATLPDGEKLERSFDVKGVAAR
ncbi:MAG: FixH family protein [Sphingomonadaceae bacterium]